MAFKDERMTTKEAAEYLGMHPGTLINWRHKGTAGLPYYKVYGSVYYVRTDIDQWIESQKFTNTAEHNRST